MSVLSFTDGDLFRVTIVKYLSTNPDRKWGNNYEVRAKLDGVTSDLNALGLKLVAMERDLHFDLIRFDRLRISTWEPDSTPYDPTTFISLPLAAIGDRPASGIELLALNVCWDVGRVPISGRFGHLFYRGALSEADTISPAGKFTLTNPTGMNTTLSDAVDVSEVSGLLDGTDATFEMVMVGATEVSARQLVTLSSRGVAVVPYDHAWFNRTPAP